MCSPPRSQADSARLPWDSSSWTMAWHGFHVLIHCSYSGHLLFLSLDRDAEAEADYRKAMALRPGSDLARIGLAFVFLNTGRLSEAEALLRASESGPSSFFAHFLLGELYPREGSGTAARTQLEQSAALQPEFAPVHPALGKVYLENKEINNSDPRTRDRDQVGRGERGCVLPAFHRVSQIGPAGEGRDRTGNVAAVQPGAARSGQIRLITNRLCLLVSKAFTPAVVESMRSTVREILESLLENVVGKEEIDIIRDIAYPLPSAVISDMLGVPPEGRTNFRQWAEDIMAFTGGGALALPKIARKLNRASSRCMAIFES